MTGRLLHRHWLSLVLSAVVMLALWQGLAVAINSPLILPLPWETLEVLVENLGQLLFWQHIGATACRSLAAFVLSVAVGSLLGAAAGASRSFHNMLELPLAVVRATPVVSFILLALFWLGSSFVPVFVAVLMNLPVMISSVETGILSCDQQLLDCCRSYGFSRRQLIRHLYIPSCKSYFFSGALSAFGLSWKVVAAGEVLSLPRRAAGTLLQSAKVHVETTQVFAVTLVLVAMSFTLEGLFSLVLRKAGLLPAGRDKASAGRRRMA